MRYDEFIMTMEALNDFVEFTKQTQVSVGELEEAAAKLHPVSNFFNSNQYKDYNKLLNAIDFCINYAKMEDPSAPLNLRKLYQQGELPNLCHYAGTIRGSVRVDKENIMYRL